jgi:hypothetical protein
MARAGVRYPHGPLTSRNTRQVTHRSGAPRRDRAHHGHIGPVTRAPAARCHPNGEARDQGARGLCEEPRHEGVRVDVSWDVLRTQGPWIGDTALCGNDVPKRSEAASGLSVGGPPRVG